MVDELLLAGLLAGLEHHEGLGPLAPLLVGHADDRRVQHGLVGEERLAALEAECARLVPLGAERVRLLVADEEDESCLVMQDIEGNEFCLD